MTIKSNISLKIDEKSKFEGKHSSDDVHKQLADDDINNESHEPETIYSKDKDAIYNCPECPYFSGKESKVLKHKEVKHKTYSCSNCDYKCANKHNFRRHNDTRHLDIRYPCSQCTWTIKLPDMFLIFTVCVKVWSRNEHSCRGH